jgi:hypothetical protein
MFLQQSNLRKLAKVLTVVAVLTQCPKNSQVNHFKVRGIWQKLSFLAEPVLIVYRNQSRGNYDHCKPLHLPLQWQDAPVKAFQYDPDLKEKKDYPKRYFCQLEVIFSPETEELTVRNLLEEPITDIPPYLKPQKFKKSSESDESRQPKPPVIVTSRTNKPNLADKSQENIHKE